MSFSYPILTEEEAQKERFQLLENGVYAFQVTKAMSKNSKPKPGKSSNPMLELQLTIWDTNGKEHYLYDYLVGTKNMAWKTRHFCNVVGLSKEYESGEFNEYLAERKTGYALIGFQEGKEKEGGGFYQPKNIVEDYVIPLGINEKSQPPIKEKEIDLSDDVPF